MIKPRLSIIDDDERMRRFIRRVAEEVGYEVFDTDSARKFIEAYDESAPDLIICDIFMPQADGIEILSLLSERQCPTPILLISGKSAEFLDTVQRLGQARGLSMAGTLDKPIQLAALRAALRSDGVGPPKSRRDQTPRLDREETNEPPQAQEMGHAPEGRVSSQKLQDPPVDSREPHGSRDETGTLENFVLAWLPRDQAVAVRYAGAVLIVSAMLAVQLAFEEALRGFPLFLFLHAVFLSSLLFGRRCGFFAAVLSAAVVQYFFMEPERTFAFGPGKGHLLPLLLFIGSGAIGAILTDSLRSALERVAASEREKDLLFRELAHRTQNDLMMLVSVLRLQAQGQPEPVRAGFEAAIGRVQAIARAHERLQRRNGHTTVNVKDYLEQLCGELDSLLRDVRSIRVKVTAEEVDLDPAVTVPVGLIVNELVTNAFKYAFPDGRGGTIEVQFKKIDPENAEIVVRDNGVGCPPTAREGLGSRLVGLLAKQLRGTVSRETAEPGCKATVQLRLRAA